MKIPTDDMLDVKAFLGLLEGAEKRRQITRVYGDGAYDSGEIFAALEARGIEPAIKPRRNSRLDTSSPARRRGMEEFLGLGYDGWAVEKGYGRRWMTETAFSTFKRLFGEHSLAQTMENISHELVAKISLYNMLVNM